MKKISLTKGMSAIVDDDMYEYLNQWRWYFMGSGYAARDQWMAGGKGKKKCVLMHRLLVGAKRGDVVDHINRDPLDNRKDNLRITDRSGNIANSKLFKTNKSGHRGICWQKDIKRWRVRITPDKKAIEGGCFKTIEEAIKCRDVLYKEYFGEFFAE